MNASRILSSLGAIDPALILQADPALGCKRKRIRRLGVIAACLAVAVCLVVLPFLRFDSPIEQPTGISLFSLEVKAEDIYISWLDDSSYADSPEDARYCFTLPGEAEKPFLCFWAEEAMLLGEQDEYQAVELHEDGSYTSYSLKDADTYYEAKSGYFTIRDGTLILFDPQAELLGELRIRLEGETLVLWEEGNEYGGTLRFLPGSPPSIWFNYHEMANDFKRHTWISVTDEVLLTFGSYNRVQVQEYRYGYMELGTMHVFDFTWDAATNTITMPDWRQKDAPPLRVRLESDRLILESAEPGRAEAVECQIFEDLFDFRWSARALYREGEIVGTWYASGRHNGGYYAALFREDGSYELFYLGQHGRTDAVYTGRYAYDPTTMALTITPEGGDLPGNSDLRCFADECGGTFRATFSDTLLHISGHNPVTGEAVSFDLKK